MIEKQVSIFHFKNQEIRVDITFVIAFPLFLWTFSEGLFPYNFPYLNWLTYWMMGFAETAGIISSIILHEVGHLVTGNIIGIGTRRITFFIFGEITEIKRKQASFKKESISFAAGIAISGVISILFYLLFIIGKHYGWPLESLCIVEYLYYFNLGLVFFNCIPAYPTDSGRILCVIMRKLGFTVEKALRWSGRNGTILAMVMILLGVYCILHQAVMGGIWCLVIGMSMINAVRLSLLGLKLKQYLSKEEIKKYAFAAFVPISSCLSIERFVTEYLYRYDHKCYPVVHDMQLLGCVSVEKTMAIPREEWEHHSVLEVIAPVSAELLVAEDAAAVDVLSVVAQMESNHAIMVDRFDNFSGIITLKDLLSFVAKNLEWDEEIYKIGTDAGECLTTTNYHTV